MTDRPSDRAIAQAFWKLLEDGILKRSAYSCMLWIEGSAREIDAAAPEGAQPIGYFDPDVLAHLADGNIDPVGVLRRKPNKTSTIPVYTTPPQPPEAAWDREDAERYRTIRDCITGSPNDWQRFLDVVDEEAQEDAAAFDRAIDAVKAARAAGGGGE